MKTFDEINDLTGFANGNKYPSAQAVIDYFTVDNMREMFSDWDIDPISQSELEEMAEVVLRHHWHCDYCDFCPIDNLRFTVVRETVPGFICGLGEFSSIADARESLDNILDECPDRQSNSFFIAIVNGKWDGFETPVQEFHRDFCIGIID